MPEFGLFKLVDLLDPGPAPKCNGASGYFTWAVGGQLQQTPGDYAGATCAEHAPPANSDTPEQQRQGDWPMLGSPGADALVSKVASEGSNLPFGPDMCRWGAN